MKINLKDLFGSKREQPLFDQNHKPMDGPEKTEDPLFHQNQKPLNGTEKTEDPLFHQNHKPMEGPVNTEVICILDKSGSMAPLTSETITGFNTFIQKQKELEGECRLTLVQFNGGLEVSINQQPLKAVSPLTRKDYQPDGNTAMLDAIGITLNETVRRLYRTPKNQQPDKVVVFIITDGEENASRQFTYSQIKSLIQELTEQNGWEFEFMGANINVMEEADKLGIARDKAEAWMFNPAGVDQFSSSMESKLANYRKK